MLEDVSDHTLVTIELGYGLVQLVDDRRGSPLVARITGVRKQLSQAFGFVVPQFRVRDSLDLSPNDYRILLGGVPGVLPGKVLVIGSASALRGMKRASTYSAARGAQLAWVQAVGVELAPWNIQVNAIAQNFVDNPTYFPPEVQANPRFQDRLKREVPLGRLVSAREDAEFAAYVKTQPQLATRLGLTVIQHQRNTGYGGNQKTCYTEALRRGADIVVMIHPDYQYDSRVIPVAVEILKLGICDVMLGSRIRTRREALDGGMPKWKYVANRGLTICENIALGQNLGDFHSGFRAYRRFWHWQRHA